MKEIIKQMAAEELERANQTFPMFASWHEAYAVLREEVEEAKDEMTTLKVHMDFYWDAIKAKSATDATRLSCIKAIQDNATKGVEELIQVIAMCDKTFESMGGVTE